VSKMLQDKNCKKSMNVVVKRKAGLVLCCFFTRNFAFTRLESLHHFSNLPHNVRFNAIWHRRSVAALIFCRRLAESDVTVTPSVTCKTWLCWWYNHVAHSISSSKAKWVRNVNLHHLVHSKWKIGKRQSVID